MPSGLDRGDLRGAGAVAAIALVAYLATICPGVYWYDSAEYAARAVSLGVPHPPGYPLYIPIAYLFTRLPFDPAFSVNLLSAVAGAAAVGLTFLLARRIGCARAAAAIAAATLAFSAPFWGNATIAEVYTCGLVFTAAVMLLLLGAAAGERRRLYAAAIVAGLGMGVHMSIATLGLGYVVLVVDRLVRAPAAGPDEAARGEVTRDVGRSGASLDGESTTASRAARSARAWLAVVSVGLAGIAATIAVFLTIPLRTFTAQMLRSRVAWRHFLLNATGGRFREKLAAKEGDWGRLLELQVDALTWVGLVAALVGAALLLRRRRVDAVALLLMAAGNLLFFVHYQVDDLEVFVLPAVLIACLMIGVCVDRIAGAAPRLVPSWPRGATRAAALALCALLPAAQCVRNVRAADRSADDSAQRYGEKLTQRLAEGAVLVKYNNPDEWERYAVFLYFQKAYGARPDVEIRTRTDPDEVAALLADDIPVYTFLRVKRLARRFVVVEEDELFELRLPPKHGPRQGRR